jgi:CheY-like chemotaxis protein
MKKARILYVDDEIGAASLLKLNLEATGRYEVNIQNWPEDALETARTFKPDLLLLDLIMPRMPGGNVVSAFEQDPELKDVPIIFFTASVWRERIQEHDGIICNHPCLAKPARLDEIAAFIDVNLPPAVRAELPAFFPATADTSPVTATAPG